MATYKPIRKTASGTEEIKIPYAVLADAPDLSKFVKTNAANTFTETQGIADGKHLKTNLIKSADDSKWIAEITAAGLEIGGSGTPLRFYSNTRPVVANQNKELAYTSDIPAAVTSINGLSGGTLTSPLTLTGGDSATASKIILSSNGQITDSGTATMLGFSGGNYIVGSANYPTTFRGKQTRPTWNGKDLALHSDVPDISNLVPKSAFSLSGTTLTITVE